MFIFYALVCHQVLFNFSDHSPETINHFPVYAPNSLQIVHNNIKKAVVYDMDS